MVVAPVPFVTTMARDPEEAVLLLIERAAPVVAPDIESRTMVVAAVMDEFVRVSVRSAAAAMLTEVKVALPDLPLTTTGLAATPDALAEVKRIPVPEVDPTKLPFVAVMAPRVAVMEVPAFTAPAVAEMFPVVAVIPVPPTRVVVVVRDPVTRVLPVVLPMATAPVPPVPMVVVADPLTFRVVVPKELKVVA